MDYRKEQQERQEWLDSLKVGDEVAISDSWLLSYSRRIYYYEIGKIERITPKRTKFIINGGREITNTSYIDGVYK